MMDVLGVLCEMGGLPLGFAGYPHCIIENG